MEAHLAALRESQDAGMDLRRVEHLLVDMREGLQRVHEGLQGISEQALRPQAGDTLAVPPAERIRARLLAMGYERIEVLPPENGWQVLVDQGGDVLVEARRAGSLYKGRVAVQDGWVGEVHLRPAHSMFP